jgi:hypothetical protein
VLCCRSGVRVIFGQWRVQPYEQRRPSPAKSIEAYDRVDRYFSFSTMISQRPMITISSPRAEVYYGEWWSAGWLLVLLCVFLFVCRRLVVFLWCTIRERPALRDAFIFIAREAAAVSRITRRAGPCDFVLHLASFLFRLGRVGCRGHKGSASLSL